MAFGYIRLDSKSGLGCKYIFFPPRFQHFKPECSSTWTKSFEESLLEEITCSSILVLLRTFIHFSLYFSLTLWFNNLFISFFSLFLILPPSPYYHTYTINLHSRFCLLLHSHPCFEPHPVGRSCPVWWRTGHSYLFFFSQRMWLDHFFCSLPSLAVVFFNRKTPVAKLPH